MRRSFPRGPILKTKETGPSMEIECPRCEQKPGVKCITAEGNEMARPHALRIIRAAARGTNA